MSNLASTLAMLSTQKAPRIIKAIKSKADLKLEISSSEEFYYVRLPLNKISLTASSRKNGNTIIIDVNKDRIGRTATAFMPKVKIEGGHYKVAELKANGETFANVWMGASALKKLSIMADDAISSDELSQKLSILINKQFKSKQQDGYGCYPSGVWIRAVYPFENYLIFDQNGDKYKIAYVLDPVSREVALAGKPTKVFEEYTDAPKGLSTRTGATAEKVVNLIESVAAIPVMPSNSALSMYTTTLSQEMNFDPINDSSKPLGLNPGTGVADHVTILNFGAPTSEYANPLLKTMMNIEEALRMYLASIADGTHTPLPIVGSPAYIQASRYKNEYTECKLAARGAGVSIDINDFLRWQTKELNASKKTKKLKDIYQPFKAFASGDINDQSTWLSADAMDESEEVVAGGPGSGRKGTCRKCGKLHPMTNGVLDMHTNNKQPCTGAGDPPSSKNAPKSMKADGTSTARPQNTSTPGALTAKKIKADMVQPMPTVNVTQPSMSSKGKKVKASFQPNAGRKKFAIGDKVKTKHGKGRISDNESSKDHVEVSHMDGKVKIMHKDDVTKL